MSRLYIKIEVPLGEAGMLGLVVDVELTKLGKVDASFVSQILDQFGQKYSELLTARSRDVAAVK